MRRSYRLVGVVRTRAARARAPRRRDPDGDDLSIIARIMAGLRASVPVAFGDMEVVDVDDLASGDVGGLPASDVLRFQLEGGSRVVVRPSGTEPKLKAYLDVRDDSAEGAAAQIAALSAAVRETLAALA